MTNPRTTAKASQLSNRDLSERELTSAELDHVSGGSLNQIGVAGAMIAQAQAQGVIRIGIRVR